jgi:hypothetical protein
MTKEELIAKSGEMITEGFVNILLRAYDEGYSQGYEEVSVILRGCVWITGEGV